MLQTAWPSSGPSSRQKNYHVLGQVAGIIRDLLQAARGKNEMEVLLVQ